MSTAKATPAPTPNTESLTRSLPHTAPLTHAVALWLYPRQAGFWRLCVRQPSAKAYAATRDASQRLGAAWGAQTKATEERARLEAERPAFEGRRLLTTLEELEQRCESLDSAAKDAWAACQSILDDGLAARIGDYVSDWGGASTYWELLRHGLQPKGAARVCAECQVVHEPTRRGQATRCTPCGRASRTRKPAPGVWWTPVHDPATGAPVGPTRHLRVECEVCNRPIYTESPHGQQGAYRTTCADCVAGRRELREPIRFEWIDGTRRYSISVARPNGTSIHLRSGRDGTISVSPYGDSPREDAHILDQLPTLRKAP